VLSNLHKTFVDAFLISVVKRLVRRVVQAQFLALVAGRVLACQVPLLLELEPCSLGGDQ
jgi:hypothetical protein